MNNHHFCWASSMISGSEKDSPAFVNGCGHKPDEFVGSCKYWHTGANPRSIDVYMHGKDQEICIRLSDEPPDYYTCGTLCDLIHSCGERNDPMLRAALELIDSRFVIRAKRKDSSRTQGV